MVLRRGRSGVFWLGTAWAFLPCILAAEVNRTIDDSLGDSQTGLKVVYLPGLNHGWNDQTCIGCAIRPDTSKAFDRTYTGATYHPDRDFSMNITMQFNGTAIYVFFILPNNAGAEVTTLTVANFTLDGIAQPPFIHNPDMSTTDFEFNQLVFQQKGLSNTQHTLIVGMTELQVDAFLSFDYAIYTQDEVDLAATVTGVSTTPSPLSNTSTSTVAKTTTSATSMLIGAASPTTSSGSITSTIKPSDLTQTTTTDAPLGTDTPTTTNITMNPTNNIKLPIDAIAGGVSAGALLIVLIIILIFCLKRRRRQAPPIAPFIQSTRWFVNVNIPTNNRGTPPTPPISKTKRNPVTPAPAHQDAEVGVVTGKLDLRLRMMREEVSHLTTQITLLREQQRSADATATATVTQDQVGEPEADDDDVLPEYTSERMPSYG
ncbi:hypothetical protein BDN70DRAFT_928029 [Pholiota conissans]|uniref:Uncharacterized protein n=1 Tax=Pholiota conissans TaxID=109636 RepID=A0A9P5ZBS6_9AGAR|nr:hypothetical protein BDN70DRAFT_928029 [Pholiota conissans]